MSTATRSTRKAGADFLWHGRMQLADAIPEDGERGWCRYTECDRELCYCRRCVIPEGYEQAVYGPKCHEHWAEELGWGTKQLLHHCQTCTCREGDEPSFESVMAGVRS